jgi:hypothetical protein
MPHQVNNDVARQAAVFGDSVIRCETRWTGPQCHWFEVCLLRVQCGGTGGGTIKIPNARTPIQIKSLGRHFGSHQPPQVTPGPAHATAPHRKVRGRCRWGTMRSECSGLSWWSTSRNDCNRKGAFAISPGSEDTVSRRSRVVQMEGWLRRLMPGRRAIRVLLGCTPRAWMPSVHSALIPARSTTPRQKIVSSRTLRCMSAALPA